MKKVFLLAFLAGILSVSAHAQFSSGSTGADGALDLSTCGTNICEVQLPESGVLNYTTVTVPGLKELRFKKNSRNTPAIILAQGSILIVGTINISADFRIPGPGGFYGGEVGKSGFGPGGGTPTNDDAGNGRWVGPLSLIPIVGGSGGGGITAYNGNDGLGGGGAIVLASSTSITLTNTAKIYADSRWGGPARPGSGGAIRLVANSLSIAGQFSASGFSGYWGGNGTNGVIRFEAPSGQIDFTGISNPAAIISTINPNIVPSAQPQLTIQSVGGYTVPSYAGSRFDTVDLLLPNQLPDPVNVVVRGNNIPVGTEVRVGFVSGSPNGTSAPCSLAGTEASSQCTATISNLNRTGVTYLLATAMFTPPAPLAKNNPKGKDQIARVRLESVLGAKPKYVFLRVDNSIVDQAKVPKEFLQYFGM